MEPKEAANQMVVEQLGRGVRGTLAVLLISWLLAALSLYLGKEWFPRSGSLMCLAGAVAAFHMSGSIHRALVFLLKEQFMSAERDIELALEPPKRYDRVLYFAYSTGAVGTVIWGYGDLIY